MKIEVPIILTIDAESANLKHILQAFVKTIKPAFESVVDQALRYFSEQYLRNGMLASILGCEKVTRKTFTGEKRTVLCTPFGRIHLPQLQVVNHDTGKRIYITRLLLGVEPRKRIPEITKRYLGLMGALAPLRVVNKFLSMFTGTRVSLMTIVRAVRDTAKKIAFGINDAGSNEFEADGTGIPILHSGKRGKELEVLVQRKGGGGIRIAGMVISAYKGGWKQLFEPLKESLKKLGSIFLVTDGDTSPLEGIQGITVILQRCLFHIPHEIKYTLWQDDVKRKSGEWLHILAAALEITNVKRIREDPGVGKNIIKGKRNRLTRLIHYCEERQFIKTASFLRNARDDLFSGIERRVMGGTTSLIERVMRTINQRINIAKWSTASALAVAKLRGAYYYNGFDI